MGFSADVPLEREAANTLAQRQGTNAQTKRIYNTYTDSSNYERGVTQWSSNTFQIGTEAAGTGTVRDMRLIGGRVGVGTVSAPVRRIDIEDSAGNALRLIRTGLASFDLVVSDVGDGVAQLIFDSVTNNTGFFFRPRNAAGSQQTSLFLGPEGNAGVGTTTPAATALLDLTSTTRGFLPPRMTTTQRDAISSPPAGLMIYNTTTNKLNVFTTAWEQITSA